MKAQWKAAWRTARLASTKGFSEAVEASELNLFPWRGVSWEKDIVASNWAAVATAVQVLKNRNNQTEVWRK